MMNGPPAIEDDRLKQPFRFLRLGVALHPVYRFVGPGGLTGFPFGAQYTHDG
jgi:hypothetical protein